MIASAAKVDKDRKDQLAGISAAVGALVLARAVDDPSLSKELLAAVRSELRRPKRKR
jgi:TetR/AcrR family transcriptional repressor of nem operon